MDIHTFASQELLREMPEGKDDFMKKNGFITMLSAIFEGAGPGTAEALNAVWDRHGEEFEVLRCALQNNSIRVRDVHERMATILYNDVDLQKNRGLQRSLQRHIRTIQERIGKRIQYVKADPEERRAISKKDAERYIRKHTQEGSMTHSLFSLLSSRIGQLVTEAEVMETIQKNMYYTRKSHPQKIIHAWLKKHTAPFTVDHVHAQGYIMRSKHDAYRDVVIA